MKNTIKIIAAFLLCIFHIGITNAQISINEDGSIPDPSAMLEVKSINKGMLVPRMSTTQREEIDSPASGLLVFDNTTNTFWFYTTGWTELGTSDNQKVDEFSISGSLLKLSLEDDGELPKMLDLSEVTARALSDADGNTQIHVEKNPDEDIIRFDLGGVEYFAFEQGRITFLNAGATVAIGEGAGENNDFSSSLRNVFIGDQTGNSNTTGMNNIGLGAQSLFTNNGNENTAIGYQTLYNNTTGVGNLAFGTGAGFNNQAGSNNVLIGLDAGLGSSLHDKFNNVMIGSGAGVSNEGDGNVFIGYQAGENENGSNTLVIENSNSNSPLIYGEFDNDLVRINGTLDINNQYRLPANDGGANQVLSTNGAGTLTWSDNDDTDTDTDDQTLSLNGSTLSIADGNSVDLSTFLPVGTILMWPVPFAPTGWIVCDGTTFDATEYPDLNDLLGGNTLPDFTGRMPIGVGNSLEPGGINHHLGDIGGAETHTLSIQEMPTHSHDIKYSSKNKSGSGGEVSDLEASASTTSTEPAGSSKPHNNMPPYLTINFIIKAQ